MPREAVFEVTLTEIHVYEVEAPTPEIALAVVTGDGRAAGEILTHRRDVMQAVRAVNPAEIGVTP